MTNSDILPAKRLSKSARASAASTGAGSREKRLAPSLGKPERLISLDVFRGITIAGMILVNNPGGWGSLYAPLGTPPGTAGRPPISSSLSFCSSWVSP